MHGVDASQIPAQTPPFEHCTALPARRVLQVRSAPQTACPAGWTTLGSHCYGYIPSGISTWYGASAACAAEAPGATLAVIPDSSTASAVSSLVVSKAWVGLTDIRTGTCTQRPCSVLCQAWLESGLAVLPLNCTVLCASCLSQRTAPCGLTGRAPLGEGTATTRA